MSSHTRWIQSIGLAIFFAASTFALAQHDHQHDHGDKKPMVKRPRVFLDKSARIVAYQLGRLDNERLLLVERKTDDPKYAPVFTAILTRAGMSPQYREEALDGLVALNQSDKITELLKALGTLDADKPQERRTGSQLARILLQIEGKKLSMKSAALKAATEDDSKLLREIGFAGLITAGDTNAKSAPSGSTAADWLDAIRLVPRAEARSALRDAVVALMKDSSEALIQKKAIRALADIPTRQAETFDQVAPFVATPTMRPTAIRTLLRVPKKARAVETSTSLAQGLVQLAEDTPAAKRTTDEFVEAMQLADQLLAEIPTKVAKPLRNRLREVAVRVVVIHTVEEEMRYDVPYFAVEAGRPVQIVLKNEDLMPHNLVITKPDALKEVAIAGAALGPKPGFNNKPFVPKSDKVLFATGMVGSRTQERLTFTAPTESGEYPFVCTFPKHWMRMYGVMIVVDDLDAWAKNPTKPKDPIGSNRSFVKSWKLEDLQPELGTGLRGRSAEIGRRIFTEATCASCHKVQGTGGAVGPELTDVFKRWKGDRLAVLREILEPSHRIDPKYAVHLIATDEGKVITGIVTAENKTEISILTDPEAKSPTVIKKSEIDEMEKTSKSMMPKALLDRFTKDEIFELLAYLEGLSASSGD